MADNDNFGILDEIHSLVSDKLQVVSYKWLSRSFSLSSNSAKQLLQEFIQRYRSGYEVTYSISGWLKSSPQVYHVRLVQGFKLADVKKQFKGDCSVQIYSVQACTPEDSAVLWNTEFLQTERLFYQPLDVSNCLRDNRFCGVSNSFVMRDTDRKFASLSQENNKLGVPPISDVPQRAEVQAFCQQLNSLNVQSASTTRSDDKLENTTAARMIKTESDNAKVKNVKSEKRTSTAGSLTNLWNRATVKSKATTASKGASTEAPIHGNADCQGPYHKPLPDDSTDEEGPEINTRKASNGESTRKRRVVFDFSDEDDYNEDIVSLSSPEPRKSGSLANSKINIPHEMKDDDCKNQKLEILHACPWNLAITPENLEEESLGSLSKTEKNKLLEVSVPAHINQTSKLENPSNGTSMSPKRRKVLKTWIDERGREVTEVVWEGERSENDKNAIGKSADAAERQSVPNKVPASKNVVPPNDANKIGSKKSGQAGAKGAKQGNIMSFFRKG